MLKITSRTPPLKIAKDGAPQVQLQRPSHPPDDSGILVMPRERVAFLVRPTDCLLMNVHQLHGNLPLTLGGTRLTAVLYARQNIHKCG